MSPAPDHTCEPPVLSGGPGAVYCDEGPLTGLTIAHLSCNEATYCLTDMCNCGSYPGLNGATASGCTVDPAGDTRFDLTVADGTVSGGVILGSSVETMHLVRASSSGDAG